ncbi:MAG: ParA family protein [Oscillospiraceae bacterium]|nr:ParA family protein [Oscillospiraceae bacterium]
MVSKLVNKVAFVNSKGGCGKTTSIFHIAGVLSKDKDNKDKAKGRVLVVDLDPQCNTTDTLLMNVDKKQKPDETVLDFITGTSSAEEATVQCLFQTRGNANAKYFGVDCMQGDVLLSKESLLKSIDPEKLQKNFELFLSEQGYSWVLIDMPPNSLTLNEICFSYLANHVIVPFSSDIFSVLGYSKLMTTIDKERANNPSLNVLGVFLARYMANCKVDTYIRDELIKNFDTFIDIQIPLSSDLRESIFCGRPISYYKEFSKGRIAFESLVSEIKKRINKFNKGIS